MWHKQDATTQSTG